MDTNIVAMHLEMIASQAKLAAYKVREGKYWPGELGAVLGIIAGSLNDLSAEVRDDR